MADVARAANVSVTTVSYVLGGRRGRGAATRISDETRQRVLAAVDTTGYRVNLPARSLRRQRTDHILVLIDRLSSPYSQKVATDISTVLAEAGIRLSVMVCPDHAQLASALEMASGQVADGAIVINPTRPFSAEVLAEGAAHGVPIVAVGSFEPLGFDVVQPQGDGQAVATAIDHLIATGRRRIAFIGHLDDQSVPESRFVAVRDRLADHGFSIDASLVRTGARDRSLAHLAALDLLSCDDPPDSIISASDIGAIATIWAAHRRQVDVPDDVAVVGCGNIDECLLTVPTLSSAGPSHLDFTPVARRMIDRLAHPNDPPELLTFEPWSFFARESSHAPPRQQHGH